MQIRLRTFLILGGVAPLLIAAAFWFLGSLTIRHPIPPHSITRTAMGETADRLLIYHRTHDKFPKTLSELPKREKFLNWMCDGWGRDLIYSVDEDGTITLKSLGRDGKPDGTGHDEDLVQRYRIRNEVGTLNIDDPPCSMNAEIQDDR